MIEDAELLRAYAEDRSEAAFAELVRRRIGLVYSVAFRQVSGDRHLAEDVVQEVFARTARNAGSLSRHPVPSGWLYRSTRFVAIDFLRADRSRRAREREAQFMHESSANAGAAVGEDRIRPALDQLMAGLSERDRNAIVLRFFEDRPFAEIGRKLKLSEDAARRRVDRALDRMRTVLVRRGLTSTTAMLAEALATQGAMAAPAGLTASATSAALASASAAGTAGVTALVLMSITKLQMGIAGVVLIAGALALRGQREKIAGLERAPQPPAVRIAAVPVSKVEVKPPPAPAESPARDALVDANADKWLGELDALKKALDADRQYWIPELALLDDRDWLIAARGAKLETDRERRALFSDLRQRAKGKFMTAAQQALMHYLQDHSGQLPNAPAELRAYLGPPFDNPEIIARYSMLRNGNVADVGPPDMSKITPLSDWALMGETAGSVDPLYDTRVQWSLQMRGMGAINPRATTLPSPTAGARK